MILLNIHQAKTELSKHLKALESGERIVICRRNVPIAEIVPIAPRPTKQRPFGLEKGRFVVPDDFNAPLPDAELDAWEQG